MRNLLAAGPDELVDYIDDPEKAQALGFVDGNGAQMRATSGPRQVDFP
ncbi:hypothetical protein [Dactylosporangium sp. CA-092794]